MSTFKDKALWPRINKAATLARHLEGVDPYHYNGYQYQARPVCHANAGNSRAFHFGDHPQGGLTLSCWNCKGGGEMVDRIEEALHMALQVRWPSGNLRYKYDAREATVISKRRATPKPAPEWSWESLPATMGPEVLQLGDVWDTKVFVAGAGNHKEGKHTAEWPGHGFRHSLPLERGGVELARYGGGPLPVNLRGREYHITVEPWDTFSGIQLFVAQHPKLRAEERRPCISLAGDSETPWPLDVMVLDGDYKATDDPTGEGLAFLHAAREIAADAGMPIFRSTSGNGFHAFMRLEQTDGKPVRLVHRGKPVRQFPIGHMVFHHGARIELLAPGDKKLVAIWRDRGYANHDDDCVVPVIGWGRLMQMLRPTLEAQLLTDTFTRPQMSDGSNLVPT